MCIASDKIKLCTCVTGTVKEMDNYWLLFRHKDAEIYIIGEPVMPYGFHIGPDYLDIHLKLADRLSQSDVFDKPLNFNEDDRLEIVFNNLQSEGKKRMKFCFRYSISKWERAFIEEIAKDEMFQEPIVGEVNHVQ